MLASPTRNRNLMICSQRPFRVSGMTRMILHGFNNIYHELFTNYDNLTFIGAFLSRILTQLAPNAHYGEGTSANLH